MVNENKKLCYRRRTARRVVSILSTVETIMLQQIHRKSITVRRLVVNSHDSYRCRQQARPSTTTTTSFVDNATDVANFFSKSGVATKFRREVPSFLEIPQFPHNTVWDRWKEASTLKPSSIRPVVSTQYGLVTDGRTDGQADTRQQHKLYETDVDGNGRVLD